MSDLDPLFSLDEMPRAPTPTRRLSMPTLILLVGLITVIIVVGIALARRGQPTNGAAPDFTATTFDGQTLRLSELRGQVVVLNFWASWCGPCREEAPTLQALSTEYAERGVVFVGIAYAEEDANSLAFMREFGITYPNAPDRGTIISENLYGITGVPETFIIDQRGQVAQFIPANVSEAQLRSILDALIAPGAA